MAYTVGQLCPKIEVPAPGSKKAQLFVSKRLHVFICQTFKLEKAKEEQRLKSRGSKAAPIFGMTKDDCAKAFPGVPESLKELLPPVSPAIIRTGLKKYAVYLSQMSKGTNEGLWMWNDGEGEMPDEQEIQEMLSPEDICKFDSMQAAILRLERMGYGKDSIDNEFNQDMSLPTSSQAQPSWCPFIQPAPPQMLRISEAGGRGVSP